MAIKGEMRDKMFREFLYKDREYIERNKLKFIKNVRAKTAEAAGLKPSQLDFLFWAYDLKFFTIRHAAKELMLTERSLGNNIIMYLTRKKYLYKYIDKLSPSNKYEDFLFRDETKFNYRVRYAMTQKGRHIIEEMYRKMGLM